MLESARKPAEYKGPKIEIITRNINEENRKEAHEKIRQSLIKYKIGLLINEPGIGVIPDEWKIILDKIKLDCRGIKDCSLLIDEIIAIKQPEELSYIEMASKYASYAFTIFKRRLKKTLRKQKQITLSKFSDRINIAIANTVKQAEEILKNHNIDSVKYQMTEMSHRLYPLSSWDQKVFKLEDWQINVIKNIDNKKNILVVAPTSAGKTVIAQYCGIKYFTLFVVPNDILAMQVAGSFNTAGINTALVTNKEQYKLDENVKVVVATPYMAENILYIKNYNFEYVVFDEIQHIDNTEGECIERLIKLITCPFIILSATIQDPDKFKLYLENYTAKNNEVYLEKYNKRFIVIQKYLFDGKNLNPLLPLACIDRDYIINDGFKSGDIAMTARDAYQLGVDISNAFPNYNKIHNIHPNTYFNQTDPITMDMITSYETKLKDILIKIALNESPAIVDAFLSNYHIKTNNIWIGNNYIASLVDLFKMMKTKDMFPALVYMSNDIDIIDIYSKIVIYLEKLEQHYFPWYNQLLLEWHEKIIKYNSDEFIRRQSISDGLANVRGAKIKEINTRIATLNRNFISDFLNAIKMKYEHEIHKAVNNSKLVDGEKQMISDFLNSDYLYKKNIYFDIHNNANEVPMPEFNPYGPTSIFSLHKTPLNIGIMRSIMHNFRDLYNKTDDQTIYHNINYTNIFMRGFERGITMYSDLLPYAVLRQVNNLINRKDAPICFCANGLISGVNLPFKTTVILGNPKYDSDTIEYMDPIKAHQASGRAGRRGYETKGNVIYMRVNFDTIMKGTFPPLTGKTILTPYSLLPTKIFNNIIPTHYINNIFSRSLNSYYENTIWNIDDLYKAYNEYYTCDNNILRQNEIMSLLLWHYRDEHNVASNIFTLINILVITYKNYIRINTKLYKNEKEIYDNCIQNHSIITQYNDDNKNTKIQLYIMDKEYTWQIVELLCRVFDRPENENQDTPFIPILTNIKHNIINEIIIDDSWPTQLNYSNNDVIKAIILNEYDKSINNISKIIVSTNKIIQYVLYMYNMFIELNNIIMVGILDNALTMLINFNNKIKLYNTI